MSPCRMSGRCERPRRPSRLLPVERLRRCPRPRCPRLHLPGTEPAVPPAPDRRRVPLHGEPRPASKRIADRRRLTGTIGNGGGACRRSSRPVTERVYNTSAGSQAIREPQDVVHRLVDRMVDTPAIPVDNFPGRGFRRPSFTRTLPGGVERGGCGLGGGAGPFEPRVARACRWGPPAVRDRAHSGVDSISTREGRLQAVRCGGRTGPVRLQSARLASTWSACSRNAGMSTWNDASIAG